MKIWLDDMRDAPDESWHVIRTAHGCLNFITHAGPGEIEILSLDHDLGGKRDAIWVVNKIEEMLAKYPDFEPKVPGRFQIHSGNPVGRKNMQAAIDSIERLRKQRG